VCLLALGTHEALGGGGAELCGPLEADTTLRLAASPYLVACDVTVPAGVALTIEAGVELRFAQAAGLRIGGRLEVLGEAGRPVVLRAVGDGGPGSWRGVSIDHGGDGEPRDSRLVHVRLEDASTLLDVRDTGASEITIEDSAFDDWSLHAVDFRFADGLRLSRCELGLATPPEHQEAETVHGVSSAVVIEHSTFGRRRRGADVIDLSGGDWGGPVPTIRYNTFLGGEDDAIDLDDSAGWVIGNVVRGFWPPDPPLGAVNGGGITGSAGNPVIANNIISDCYHGIGFKDGSGPLVVNNLVVGCHVGLTFYKADCDAPAPVAVLHNNIIWDNRFAEGPRAGEVSSIVPDGTWFDAYCQEPAGQSVVEVSYSIVAGGWPGEGNLDADPLLADVGRRDFSLLPGSPALDSGFGGPLSLPGPSQPDAALLAAVLARDRLGSERQDLPCVEEAGGGEIAFLDRGPLEALASAVCLAPGTARFLRADANGDGDIDLGDAVASLFVLFDGAPSDCLDALDADDDGSLSLDDVLRVLNYVFQRGPVPAAPFPGKGADPTKDSLGCTRDPSP
jgi:parallel beta-helix repeat protein